MESRSARVVRGSSAAAFATFTAGFSHALAGGSAPSAFGVGVALVIAVMICTLLAGRAVSLPRLAIAIGFSQALFHLLFSGLGTPTTAPHHMAGGLDASLLGLPEDATMWSAHVVAALISIVAFRFGERAFWTLAAPIALVISRLLGVAASPVMPSRPVVVASSLRFAPRELALLLSTMRHRGPPREFA